MLTSSLLTKMLLNYLKFRNIFSQKLGKIRAKMLLKLENLGDFCAGSYQTYNTIPNLNSRLKSSSLGIYHIMSGKRVILKIKFLTKNKKIIKVVSKYIKRLIRNIHLKSKIPYFSNLSIIS